MTTLDLKNIKKNELGSQQFIVRSKIIMLTMYAFLTGALAVVEPISLLTIPTILLFYGTYKAIIIYKEISNLDLSIDAFNIPLTDIVNDLEKNNH